MDSIGGHDAVEVRQGESPGHIGLEEAESGAGEEPIHGGAQHLQAGPILIDGDDCRVWTGNVSEGEREGTAAGTEINPDATAVPVDSMFEQLDVIGVVHQTNPREGVDTERTWA